MTNNHRIIFMPSGRRGRAAEGETLLEIARRLGVDIESICGGKLTCGKCLVRVEDGTFQKDGLRSDGAHLSPPVEAERLLLERLGRPDCRLSCAARVQGDALLTVPEESRAHKQVIRKAATERAIDVAPAVRQVYVTVDRAELGEHRGDWGRLQAALASQWGLDGLTIDLTALRRLQMALRRGEWAVTVTLWNDREVIDVRPGYEEGVFGLAVDIGSTTLAAYVCNLRTGELLATGAMMNPQVTYGEDLMSRISYAMTHPDGLETMHAAIVDALNRLAAHTAKEAGLRARNLHEAVMVGNTTMIHLLLKIDPVELGGAPFALANRDMLDLKARELGLRLHPGANLHIMPAEAGHVGADNVAVLVAEAPHRRDDLSLIVDVGTNGEIALGNRHWLYSASSPTGPAFEGAQITFGMRAAPGAIERVRIDPATQEPRFRVIGEERWSDEWRIGADVPPDEQPRHLAAGICGSGIIEAVAELYLSGVILPEGRFNPHCRSERIRREGRKVAYVLAAAEQTTTGRPILVTQEDVRSIQLAKAALYAGAKLLMNRAGAQTVDRIVLAGAFGSYIDPTHAMALGLIPDCDLSRVFAVGNAAGDGARIALLNRRKRIEAQELAHRVHYIETAVDPDFQTEFVAAMHLPHRRDPFPHLRDILPDAPVAPVRGRKRRHSRSV
ncbi:MAG: ASKHA domain-containing protein [Anaerolineae bacterium]